VGDSRRGGGERSTAEDGQCGARGDLCGAGEEGAGIATEL